MLVRQSIDDAPADSDKALISFKRMRVALVSIKPINTEFGKDRFVVCEIGYSIAPVNEFCKRTQYCVGGFRIMLVGS